MRRRCGFVRLGRGLLVEPSPEPSRRREGAADQPSLAQSRGVIFFSAAYLAALSSTILRIMSESPLMNPVSGLKWVPSHCWNLTIPEPSWSRQLVLIGGNIPAAP